MSSAVKVIIFGATGQTGHAIVDGLLESTTNFDITAVSRPVSVNKPENEEFKKRGVKVVGVDIEGPRQHLVEILRDADVVLAPIFYAVMDQQKIIIDACKEAGAKRFIPSNFGPVMPPVGVMKMREKKEEIINYIKFQRVPFTIIDVAWWYQGLQHRIPSGRTDYMVPKMISDSRIPGDGETPFALADLNSIGKHVARIIADPRTVNKYLHVYDEVLTHHQIIDTLEKLSGEKVNRVYNSAEEIEETLAANRAILEKDPGNIPALISVAVNEYFYSAVVRGDNTPEVADYLGYLDTYKLYPDLKPTLMRVYLQDVLDKKRVPPEMGGMK